MRLRASLLALAVVALAACGPVEAGTEPVDLAGRAIKVVATTGMVADVVKNVGGERLEVTELMGPGIDPHAFKASERNVISLAEADLIFYNGLHLEAKMAEVFERMGGRVRTVAIAHAVDESELLSPPEFEGQFDPHVWFDVSLWAQTVDSVEDALAQADPSSAQLYRDNAAGFKAELEDLDAYVGEQVALIPPERRVLITAHDAFNYFGEGYGFEVRGLQGISTATEAGAADVRSLAEEIAEREIPAIFIETSVSTRFVQAVQEAVRARGFDVAIGGELFSDAMGDAGTPEGTYIGMVRHNIDTIVGGLTREED